MLTHKPTGQTRGIPKALFTPEHIDTLAFFRRFFFKAFLFSNSKALGGIEGEEIRGGELLFE